MKYLKKMAAFVAVVTLALCMGSVAFAAETGYKITIENEVSGHTYEAYQIFTGDLYESTLSNIVWGDGVSEEGQLALGDAVKKAESVVTTEDATAFAQEIEQYLADPTASVNQQTGTVYEMAVAEPGYYLIKDKDGTLIGANDSYTLYILKVVKDVTAQPKSANVTSEKKVDDKNDSTTSEDDVVWQDSADYDIGDAVPFKLTGTVAANYDAYTVYKYAFHDVECDGLSFDAASVKVYVDGTKIESGYEVETDCSDGCTFEVVFDDLKEVSAVGAGSTITVEYTSTLNDQAVLGSAGNPNVMYLEYSNNPNDETGAETGKTVRDKVIVFTYKVIVNKVDEKGGALAGAGFTLYKKSASGEYVAVGTELKGESMTTFTWSHIDDGDYKLVETTTPAGYNTMAPVEFTVSATHDAASDDPQLTVLTGDSFTGSVETGALSSDITNKAGTVLPETGGIGTVMFYVVGGLLVIGAVALLVTRRRTGDSE